MVREALLLLPRRQVEHSSFLFHFCNNKVRCHQPFPLSRQEFRVCVKSIKELTLGHKLEGVNEKERAVLSSTVELWKAYTPRDCPTILDPLILGCLLDDMPRVAWMVFKCGGNLIRAPRALIAASSRRSII